MEIIALLRDISLVYLILLCFTSWLVPLVALFFAQKYVRLGRHKLKPILLIAQLWARRAQDQTNRAARQVIRVPIELRARVTQAQATAHAIKREFFE